MPRQRELLVSCCPRLSVSKKKIRGQCQMPQLGGFYQQPGVGISKTLKRLGRQRWRIVDSVGEICQDNRLTRLPALGHLTHQLGKASASGLTTWRLSEHGIQAQQIESRSTGHMLQVRLGLPKIACPSQAHHPHSLRNGGFHPGTDGIASPELGGLLLGPPLLQGGVHRLRAQRQGAWTFLALGTELTHRTGFAHRGRKADLDGWQSEGILLAEPTARTLALGTGHLLALPVDGKILGPKALPSTLLPTAGASDGPQQLNAPLSAAQQQLRVGIARVYDVLAWGPS